LGLQNLLTIPALASFFKIWPILALLIIISIYDMWAVWKSKLMVRLAKFQIENVKIFTGFLVPYMPKKEALKLRAAQKIKTQRSKVKALRKIKISLAMLGGGDVAFPLIFAGVIYRSAGLIPALMIVAGSTIALMLLFMYSKKGRFYPAMPFITAGCIVAWLLSLLI
jgi:presenilin-like A22 family membrane protease